jgi:hypothetical protein
MVPGPEVTIRLHTENCALVKSSHPLPGASLEVAADQDTAIDKKALLNIPFRPPVTVHATVKVPWTGPPGRSEKRIRADHSI